MSIIRRLVAPVLAIAISTAHTAQAQEAPADEAAPPPEAAPAPEATAGEATTTPDEMEPIEDMSLEELLGLDIRVSAASLFDERGADAPATVALITDEDWERRGARRTLDALENQPATMVYPYGRGGSAVAVRGYASSGSVRGVAVLLDGVPLNDIVHASALQFTSNIELPTLDRIEMVRGPGSALYGTDAFHGVLSLRTFSPTSDVTSAGGEIGTDGFHRGYARTRQSIGETTHLVSALAYSGLPDQSRSFAYTDPDTGAPAEGVRGLAYRSLDGTASVEHRPTNAPWDLAVAFHANVYRAIEAPGSGRSVDQRSLLEDGDRSGSRSELYLGRTTFGFDFDNTLRLEATGYGYVAHAFERAPTAVPTVAGPVPSESETEFTEGRQGLRLTMRQETNKAHTRWVAGYELSNLRLYDGGYQRVTDPLTQIEFYSATYVSDDFRRMIHSAFLSAETRVANERVRLHYGGRIDYYSDFGVQATPRLGIVVAPRSSLSFKALYGRAFRAPSLFEKRGDGAEIASAPSIRPELIDTFELSAMHLSERHSVQLTGFASVWHDAIVLVPITHPSFSSRYGNAGRNHSLGAEASWTYLHGPYRVDASGSYTRSWNDDTNTPYSAFPQVIGNVGVGYTVESIRLRLYLFQRIAALMTEGDPVPNAALRNPADLSPYYRVDLHVGWEAIEDHLLVFVNLRNAFGLTNTVPSLANAENGAQTPGINASLGVRGSL